MKIVILSLIILLAVHESQSIYFGVSMRPFCFDIEQ